MASGRLRGVRVLLVDEDDAARRAALTALATEDAAVTPVATLASALGLVCFLRPDVIVVDLSMEGDGGWRLLEALRKREPEAAIPVVATSRAAGDGEAALHGGFAAFVAKPFDTETLRATVTRVAIAAALGAPRA
jgi:CheY-like chemotaxis protein